jgi:predicted DNA-binding WGR domain protein
VKDVKIIMAVGITKEKMMAMYISVEREGKWEVLFSHVNGDDLIKRCDTEEQAEKLIRVLEGEQRKTVYLVKSFGHEGYTNLKVFSDEQQAEKFAEKVRCQIPLEALASGDESVEIEEFTLEEI